VGVNTVIPPSPAPGTQGYRIGGGERICCEVQAVQPHSLRLILQPSPSRGTLLKLPPLQGEGLGGDGVKGCGGNLVQEL
jgi:hypothetical protein